MKFLHYLDLFGIPYEQPYMPNKKIYKSSFGGCFTITLYSLSLLYFVFKIHSWLTGGINPKSTQIYQVQQNVDLLLNYPLISISFDQQTEQLDPLNQKEKIIQAYLITQQNQSINIANFESQNNNKIVMDNFNFSLSDSQTSLFPTQTFLALQLCNRTQQVNCASDDKIQQFLQLSGLSMKIDMNFLYFNAQLNQYERITKTFQYAIETDVTLLNVFQLQMQKNIINNGFLFDNIIESQVINDVQIITQSVQQEYFSIYLNGLIAVYEFNLNQLVQIQLIQFAKISEILADVGSIISTLMALKGLAIAMNTYLLEELINQQIISCYYPQFKELKINRNLFGQIKSVQHFHSYIDLIEFNKFYTKAKQIALKKKKKKQLLTKFMKSLDYNFQYNYQSIKIKYHNHINLVFLQIQTLIIVQIQLYPLMIQFKYLIEKKYYMEMRILIFQLLKIFETVQYFYQKIKKLIVLTQKLLINFLPQYFQTKNYFSLNFIQPYIKFYNLNLDRSIRINIFNLYSKILMYLVKFVSQDNNNIFSNFLFQSFFFLFLGNKKTSFQGLKIQINQFFLIHNFFFYLVIHIGQKNFFIPLRFDQYYEIFIQ